MPQDLRASHNDDGDLARFIIESSNDVIISKDLDGIITGWNHAAEEVYGYSAAEMIGQPMTGLFAPGNASDEREILSKIKRGEPVTQADASRRRKDGTLFNVSILVSPIRDAADNLIGAAHVERDITQRLRAEELLRRQTEALRESEERFHLAVSGTDAGLWDWNPETDEVYFSPRFKEILGYGDDEFPNSARAHRDAIHPGDLAGRNRALMAHLDSNSPYDIEYRMRTKSGAYRWVNARGRAIRDRNGKAYRVVGWIIDIDDRKRIEHQLAESRQQLRNLNMRAALDREAERARISREVHDELGQGLTAIKLDLHWLAGKVREDIAPRERDAIRERIRETESLADKTTAAIQRIAMELRPGALDHLGLSAAVRDEARRFGARAGIEIHIDIPAELEGLDDAVATAAFRILQELLTNVARHARAKAVWIYLDEIDDTLVMRVKDDGVGMPADAAAQSTSLGLLGIRERAAEHGGSVIFGSTTGKGTHATVRIPTTDKSALERGDA